VTQSTSRLVRGYIDAKLAVLAAGFGPEIVWQRSRPATSLTEAALLREAAWVILSAGMRETVVRSKFPSISTCFFNWESAARIATSRQDCVNAALIHFRHQPKVLAIFTVAQTVYSKGFETVKAEIARSPLAALQQFPYIGPITGYHLAKNLGVHVAKPDRHLSRLALACGYVDAHALCDDIEKFTGDPIDVVDIILWRFATISSPERFVCAFTSGAAQS